MFEDTRQRMNLALEALVAQLEGLDARLDEAEAPGEMTVREQLSHLLGPEDADFAATLRTFSETAPPRIPLDPEGAPHRSPARDAMTLAQYIEALRLLHRRVQIELGTLPPQLLERRRALVPEWAPFTGSEEVSLETFVLGHLESHWMEHAEQIARLR